MYLHIYNKRTIEGRSEGETSPHTELMLQHIYSNLDEICVKR